MNDLIQPAPVALSNLSLPQLIDTLPREEAQRITTPSPIASKQSSPLYGHAISAGFPSPADDYVESKLDLNQLLVRNKAATFFLRVKGDSMTATSSWWIVPLRRQTAPWWLPSSTANLR